MVSNFTYGITMGDPAGIGPEIILKAIKNQRIQGLGQHMVIGDAGVLEHLNKKLGLALEIKRVKGIQELTDKEERVNVLDLANVDMKTLVPGKVQAQAGKAAVEYLKKAVILALVGEIDAIVTTPLNKEAIHQEGFKYPGHTEILAELTGTEDFAMLLSSDKLNVIHVTTHISLEDSCRVIDKKRVETVIKLADKTLKMMGLNKPKIAVAGFNPHAGENGLFGKQEMKVIGPAVNSAKKQGINVDGPIPPDTVFVKALEGRYDIVVAMYHDQGHIPFKLLAFDKGVNITAGLPIIRTSVDHGTAFDIAWQGIARETSLIEAVKLAKEMSLNK